MGTAVAVALGVALVAAGFGVLALWLIAGEDPPADPPKTPIAASPRHSLFRRPEWRRVGAEGGAGIGVPYHRPTPVEPIPEDGLLPAPRPIRGINEEE